MSERHILHVQVQQVSNEWQAWCCCGWASMTWRTKDAAKVAAETHMAYVNSEAARLDGSSE